MKCIACSKPAVAEHFCKDCFLESYTNVIGFKDFRLWYCSACHRYAYTQKWNARLPLEEAIAKAVKANTKTKHALTAITVTPSEIPQELKPGQKPAITIDVKTKTKIYGLTKTEEYTIHLKLTIMLCDRCQRKETEYFEGVIQLRNKQSSQFDAALDFIRNEVHKQKHKGIFITIEEPTKDGIDLYCTHQRYLPIIAKKVYAQFGGECKLNTRNFTQDKLTSKQVYRVNAVLRLPAFSHGDVIKVDHLLVNVVSIFGKNVSGIELKAHKKVLLQYKEYEVIVSQNEIHETMITKHKPFLEILDPVSYQSVTVANPKEVDGDHVKCVMIDGRWWVVA